LPNSTNFGKTNIMTPKEKAFELAHKFRLLEIRTSENSYMMISMADAKQCALIAVDEILNGYEYDSLDIKHKRIMDNINYWDKVKQEIENL
jgi:hypothetical protein